MNLDTPLYHIECEIDILTDELNNDLTDTLTLEDYHYRGGRLEALKWVKSLLDTEEEK